MKSLIRLILLLFVLNFFIALGWSQAIALSFGVYQYDQPSFAVVVENHGYDLPPNFTKTAGSQSSALDQLGNKLVLALSDDSVAATKRGQKLLPAPKIHKHHLFPQAQRDWFAKRGIDIDQHTIPLERGTHLAGTHGKGGFVGPGNVQLPGKWNQRWNDFIKNNPNATAKETYQYGGKLMDEFGFNNLPIGPYK